MKENKKENTKKDLRKVVGCKLNNGTIYLAESVCKTLYRVAIDGNTTSLYFNSELDLIVNPEAVEWIDVTNLQEYRNGVFYNPDEYLPSGGYGWWMREDNMITFVENDKDKDKA